MRKTKKKIRGGIAAIVLIKEKGKIKFLLLKRKQHWKGWEWVKGGSKRRESLIQTLKREIKEETRTIKNYKIKKTPYFHYFLYQRPFIKDKIKYWGAKDKVFLIYFFEKEIKINKKEHSGFGWFSKRQALKKITWPDQKKLFKKVTKNL